MRRDVPECPLGDADLEVHLDHSDHVEHADVEHLDRVVGGPRATEVPVIRYGDPLDRALVRLVVLREFDPDVTLFPELDVAIRGARDDELASVRNGDTRDGVPAREGSA